MPVKKGDNYKLEQEIARLVEEMNVTIPIINVKNNVFLIGT